MAKENKSNNKNSSQDFLYPIDINPNVFKKNFYALITALKDNFNVTQVDIGKAVGLTSKNSLTAYYDEKSTVYPSVLVAYKLCKYLNIQVESLFSTNFKLPKALLDINLFNGIYSITSLNEDNLSYDVLYIKHKVPYVIKAEDKQSFIKIKYDLYYATLLEKLKNLSENFSDFLYDLSTALKAYDNLDMKISENKIIKFYEKIKTQIKEITLIYESFNSLNSYLYNTYNKEIIENVVFNNLIDELNNLNYKIKNINNNKGYDLFLYEKAIVEFKTILSYIDDILKVESFDLESYLKDKTYYECQLNLDNTPYFTIVSNSYDLSIIGYKQKTPSEELIGGKIFLSAHDKKVAYSKIAMLSRFDLNHCDEQLYCLLQQNTIDDITISQVINNLMNVIYKNNTNPLELNNALHNELIMLTNSITSSSLNLSNEENSLFVDFIKNNKDLY